MKPHQHIGEYYTTDAEKRRFLDTLFSRTATDYDRISQVLSIGSGEFYRRFVLTRLGLRHGMRVLDVGSGTGLVARAAAGLLGTGDGVIGVEPNDAMILEGRKSTQIPFIRAVAESLPVTNEHFDLVTMGYALRHVADLNIAFGEFFRVLRSRGQVALLELSRPTSRTGLGIVEWYLGRVVPRLTRLVTGNRDAELMMRYYWDTIATCVPPVAIVNALRAAGFKDVRRTVYFGVFSEYYGTKP